MAIEVHTEDTPYQQCIAGSHPMHLASMRGYMCQVDKGLGDESLVHSNIQLDTPCSLPGLRKTKFKLTNVSCTGNCSLGAESTDFFSNRFLLQLRWNLSETKSVESACRLLQVGLWFCVVVLALILWKKWAQTQGRKWLSKLSAFVGCSRGFVFGHSLKPTVFIALVFIWQRSSVNDRRFQQQKRTKMNAERWGRRWILVCHLSRALTEKHQ